MTKLALKVGSFFTISMIVAFSIDATAADSEKKPQNARTNAITAKEIVLYYNGGALKDLKGRIDSQGAEFSSKDNGMVRSSIANAVNDDPKKTALGLNDQTIDKVMTWLEGQGIVDPPPAIEKSPDQKKDKQNASEQGSIGVNKNAYLFRSPAKDQMFIPNLGLGYEYSEFESSDKTYWLSFSLYNNNRMERQDGGWNHVLKPDWYGEIAHSLIPAGTNAAGGTVPTLGEGARIKFGLFWPIPQLSGDRSSSSSFDWNTNYPFAGNGLHLNIGPVFNFGLEKVFGGGATNSVGFLAHNYYGGIRASLAPDNFVEYTVGNNRLLDGIRYRLVAQFPIFIKSESGIRYYIRTTWDTSKSKQKDILQFVFLVDVPLDMILKPSQYLTLIPVLQ